MAQPASKGADLLVVQNPESVPLTGKITRIGELRTCTSFIRRAGSAELAINPALPMDVPAGTPLTIGPCGVENEFVRESCAIRTHGSTGGTGAWVGLGCLVAVGWVRRRLARRA